MGEFPVKDKPPHNRSVLERWLTEASKQTGVAAGRLRRWLGFMVVAAMLDEARHADDGEPLFLVKGGVAMELRVDTGRGPRRIWTPLSGRAWMPSPIISTRPCVPATATSLPRGPS